MGLSLLEFPGWWNIFEWGGIDVETIMDTISLVIAALVTGAIEERKVNLGQRIEI